MRSVLSRMAIDIARALAYGLVGGFAVLVAVFVQQLESRPDLEVWHTADLDAEFTASSDVESFAGYLALEDRLFAQLDDLVVSKVPTGPEQLANRLSRGSLSDPGRWPRNWNRSYELARENPRATVLLLHGMSDGPYSLRSLAEALHRAGAHVVALRLPGHGTAPSGLVRARWQDMAAAVRLGVAHLREAARDAPLFLVGYSNGAALSVQYALASLEDETLPRVAGIALISPAIGVTPLAALAVWQSRLGSLLGLHKLAWSSIEPEYDPFKYVSFAVNAGDQTYRLTARIQEQLSALADARRLGELPPILAFQSAVDATVSSRALVENLFFRIPEGGHELVLFDLNRIAHVEPLLASDPRDTFQTLLANRDLDFTFSVLTNESEKTPRVEVHWRAPGAQAVTRTALALEWPPEVYSLSHVALPFRPDDPVYGGRAPRALPGLQIGSLAARGERGVLRISGNDMLRLRWNPFHDYLEQRVLSFAGLGDRGGEK